MNNFNASEFCNHIYQYGLMLDPSRVKIDGRWHNCKLIDNKSGWSGCYIVYVDSGIAQFKSWREPDRVEIYKPKGTNISNSDFRDFLKQEKQKQAEIYFKVSQESYRKYESIPSSGNDSEYATRKQISSITAKVDQDGNLVIPFYNYKGYVSTLQTIYTNGRKYFEKGGELTGSFHKIGFTNCSCLYMLVYV